MERVVETISLASLLVGMFAYGLWTGRMPMNIGSMSREENDWGFWMVGGLYLFLACAVIFIGLVEPKL